PNASGQVHGWASSQALRFNILPTDTSVSFGADISSTDDKWLRTLSAEQKLFGGPFSVTGSVSETATGDLSKSLKAGFKRSWCNGRRSGEPGLPLLDVMRLARAPRHGRA